MREPACESAKVPLRHNETHKKKKQVEECKELTRGVEEFAFFFTQSLPRNFCSHSPNGRAGLRLLRNFTFFANFYDPFRIVSAFHETRPRTFD